MIVDPALIAIAAITLGGLALWVRCFFLSFAVSALVPKRPSQRRGGA
jgi:hypothetical protein